jgi:hypothetical protein
MARRLIKNRLEPHLPYGYEAFKENFGKYFIFIEEKCLSNKRSLFCCEKK